MELDDHIIWVYLRIEKIYQRLTKDRPLRSHGFAPALSDAEVLTMQIIGEMQRRHEDKAIWRYFRDHWLACGEDQKPRKPGPNGAHKIDMKKLAEMVGPKGTDRMLKEIASIRDKGVEVTPKNLMIAENATLILPVHQALDTAMEEALGAKSIGTTRRGIGPAYEDKVARRAIRVCDLAHPELLKEKLDRMLWRHNVFLKGINAPEISGDETYKTDYFPASQVDQAAIKPIYETMEGWAGTTRGARTWAALPAAAVKYVRHIEELIGAPVTLLSTSPDRDDTILMRDPFLG